MHSSLRSWPSLYSCFAKLYYDRLRPTVERLNILHVLINQVLSSIGMAVATVFKDAPVFRLFSPHNIKDPGYCSVLLVRKPRVCRKAL